MEDLVQDRVVFDEQNKCIRATCKDYEIEGDEEDEDDYGRVTDARFKFSFSSEGWSKLKTFLAEDLKRAQIRRLEYESLSHEDGECSICDEHITVYKLKCCEVNLICEQCYINLLDHGNKQCPFCKSHFKGL